MKLLSIKAHGFKSFADKIEINVGDGITGIVGPNGSGKSNVVDAIKWVLGENSLKEIRGGEEATDVIFAGSASRHASTRAWVSLTFDNQDHYLASDYPEIEIKREVYKTGENDYFINNTKVRKKDITDLFIDSGANADSFSIISQGKIGEILKGRSIDRRTIIEEAAGVLKYKKRKDETIRKLDNAKDNLEKVNLVIDELDASIEPLRASSAIAKKYLEYKDELKEIEIALLANDIKVINDEYQNSKTRLATLNEELLNMESSTNIDSSKLEKLKNENIKLDEKITSSSEQVIRYSEILSSLETKKQVLSERKKYEVEDQKLESNILILKEQELNLKKNIILVNNEIDNLKQEVKSTTTSLDNINEEYRVTYLKKNTLTSELSNKVREESNLKNKIDILNETIENDSKLPFAVKSVLNNPRLNGIHDVLCKLIDTEEKYAKSIEIALGGNANVIVVDDEASATKAIEYLKDNRLGRATFFPISVIKARGVDDDTLKICKSVPGFIDTASSLVTYNPLYKSIIENQLGNTLIVNNIDTMNKLGKKIGYRYRIISLEGELLHTGGAMTGGEAKASNGIINAKFELEKLNKDYNIVVNEIKLIEEHINSLDNEIKILEQKVFDTQTKDVSKKEILARKEQELSDLNKNLEAIKNEISGTNNVLKNEVDKELEQVLEEYLNMSTKKELEVNNLSTLKTKKDDIINEINELESIARKSNSEYNKKLNEIKDLEIGIGKMDVKLDNYLNRLSEEYQLTYEKAYQDYTLDIDEFVARTKVNHLRRDIKDLGEVNVGSISEFERINERYTFLTEQRNDLESSIANLMEIIADLDETMKQRFEETFNKVNEEFNHVFKKLFKGGTANLVLTNPSDLLTTGVDINALPPGKNLKNITTLSGGEMTLTAIALLFSILNIRTVPFCVLDEVEAALDEANVDTFGTYIKEYEQNSQFIVITHKKRTMEYANTLYGVTMQESGVSKLVSVKLESLQ